MVPFAATVRGGSRSRLILLLRFWRRKQPSFAAFFQPVTFAPNVHGGRMMEQSIQNRRRNDGIAENRTPLAIALVGSKYDAAPFIAGADELKENRRAQLIQRQI